MSEYEELREDIGAVAKAVDGYSATAISNLLEQSRQIDKLWKDNSELRGELYAVANRLENLTRAVTTSPAEVAAAIVTDANRSTLRRCETMADRYYYVCDSCGSLVTVADSPLPEGEQWECSECGSEAAWEFTDAESACLHAAHIQCGNESGLFRDPV